MLSAVRSATDRSLERRWVRATALAALFVAMVVCERADLITLLASWTERVFPRSHYPALFALLFATYAALDLASERWRKPMLLAASVGAACIFDVRFAAISVVFFIGYYAVVFSRAPAWSKLAFLIATFAAWAVACDLLLLPDFLVANPWLLGFGYMFALNYTFRLFYFHHEMSVRRFERVPLADFLLYFLFAPFFVIVPHMLAIPRYGRFTEGLTRRDSKVIASGVRWLAAGLAVSLACWAVTRVYDVKAHYFATIRRRDFVMFVPFGILAYPVWTVLENLGPAYFVVGLLRIFGVPIGPAFDRALSSTSVLEWWRRWNIHFREFLVDLFFYPVALRFRRWPRLGIVLACVSVFIVGSTLFHWPRRYFGVNSPLDPNLHLVVENAVWCVLVAIALLREQSTQRKQRALRSATKKPVTTAAPSWTSSMSFALRVGRTWAIVFGVVIVLGYGSGFVYEEVPANRAASRFREAHAAAAAGDRDRAWVIAGPLLPELRTLARRQPREPLRRLELAWTLTLPSPARDPIEAGAHLRVARAFLNDADTEQHTLYAETLAQKEGP